MNKFNIGAEFTSSEEEEDDYRPKIKKMSSAMQRSVDRLLNSTIANKKTDENGEQKD